MLRRSVAPLLLVLAPFLAGSPVSLAQPLRGAGLKPMPLASAKTGLESGRFSKVGRDLAVLYQDLETHRRSQSLQPFEPSSPLMRLVDGRVVVDAVANDGDTAALRAALEALGLEGAASFGPVVSGWLPVAAIADVAALDGLRFARPAYSTTNVGLTTSQGDAAMRADAGRASFGVDGTGVTVGTLSDSYDCLSGAAADVGSGDLPAGVTVLLDGCPGGSDEGRGMMQLIADVAPGASQAFHTAGTGQAGFATGILDLAGVAGADVIVDDIIYFAEPMFQDGIIAQAVDSVFASGVPYFSSAGNNAREAHEDGYRPGVDPVFAAASHDWDPGPGTDFYQSLTIPEGTGIFVVFQWDEPYASATGGAGSANDVDIYLFDDPPSGYYAAGLDPNVGGDPIEIFTYFNPADSGVTAFNLFLELFAGPAPSTFKYVLFSFSGTVNEYFSASGTVYGHANAAGAEAVGAAFYFETPEFGTDPALLEPFSSAGPMAILFDLSDTPVVDVRPKPEIVCPDGGNTTFFGSDIPDPGDGSDLDAFPNFFGTSAAAPHAAAVAALMLEGAPSLTPSAVYSALESTAADMGPAGFDDDSGFGFCRADQALGALLNPLFADGFESGDTTAWSSSVP